VYRDDYYYLNPKDKGIGELIVEQNSNGLRGPAKVKWNRETASFTNLNSKKLSSLYRDKHSQK